MIEATEKYTYGVYIENIVDADTVDLRVHLKAQEVVWTNGIQVFDCGFGIYVPTTSPDGFCGFFRDRFRLYGIDAWETRGEEKIAGKRASQALLDLLDENGREMRGITHKDKRGKYGRWLVDLTYKSRLGEPLHVNEWLVQHGHAIHT
jgi:endonuclease YncB( thermonuclease family)